MGVCGHGGDGGVGGIGDAPAVTEARRRQDGDADQQTSTPARHARRRRRRPTARLTTTTAVCALLATSLPTATAQNGCISLADSSACSAFSAASVSTNDALTGLFPFLADVTDVSSFDSELQSYIDGAFARLRCVQCHSCSANHAKGEVLTCEQVRPTHRLFQLQLRQHHRVLRAIHHQRAM